MPGRSGTQSLIRRIERVAFRSEDDVALGKPADLVRPDTHANFAPCDVQVRMMPLLFGNVADTHGEGHGIFEVVETVLARQYHDGAAALIGNVAHIPSAVDFCNQGSKLFPC